MESKSVYCLGAEVLIQDKTNDCADVAFMFRYGERVEGWDLDEEERRSLEAGISAYLPVSSSSFPTLKQLSLLKLMSNFDTGEEFADYLNTDDGNIESMIAKNVYQEVLAKSKQLPIVASVDSVDWDLDNVIDWYFENLHEGIITRELQVIVDRITSLHPFSKELEVVEMEELGVYEPNDEEFRYYLTVKANKVEVNVHSETKTSNKRMKLNNSPMDCWTELAFYCTLQELRRLGVRTDDKAEFSLLHSTIFY